MVVQPHPLGEAGSVQEAIADTDLLTALYQGPLDTPLWTSFLSKLRDRLAVNHVSLAFRRADAPVTHAVSFQNTEAPRDARALAFVEQLHQSSPLPYYDMEPGKPQCVEDFLDDSNPTHMSYLRDYLRPRGHRHMLVLRVVEPAGSNAWLAISRRDEDFDDSIFRYLAGLARHLTTAIRYLAVMEDERHRADISTEAARKLNFAWVSFASTGEILAMDDEAARLLKAARILSSDVRGNQRLKGASHGRLIQEALQVVTSPTNPRSRAIHLSDDPWLDLLLMPRREKRVSGARTPVAVGYLHGDAAFNSDRGEQLSELFGLTRTEAGLALALCRGRSIAESAVDLGLTIETARNYSKRIYFKMGTRGQADLVRLILCSVVALA